MQIFPTIRVRKTPFWDGVIAAGAKTCSVYNHMILPVTYETPERDYRHLKQHVQIWDVACERQIEVSGTDATKLLTMLVPRNVIDMKPGKCFYFPAVDHKGGILNDPVLLKFNENRYWISVADSDLLLWALGIAVGQNLDVEIWEPDVSPLAVQGPKSQLLMERVFGSKVAELSFFCFDWFSFNGKQFVVSRSGYSKQDGFEIYVDGTKNGMQIWNALLEAGQDLYVRPGSPTYAERVEGGLLSYGSDITRNYNPFECGLGRYCDIQNAPNCIATPELERILDIGIKRQIRSLSIEGEPVPICHSPWPINVDGNFAGYVTSATWSWDYETNVAIGMIESEYWDDGVIATVQAPDGYRNVHVRGNFYN